MPSCLGTWWTAHGICVLLLWGIAFTGKFPWYNLDWKTLNPLFVRHRVPVHRHRDPLRMNVQRPNIPVRLQLGDKSRLELFTSTKRVKDYIEEYVLFGSDVLHKEAAAHFSAVEKQHLSPLHVSMFLMGCYGYAYMDRHTSNITGLLSLEVMWTEWSTPFLLDALETRYASSKSTVSDQVTPRDHSACTCMKDFASPTLLHLKEKQKVLDLKPDPAMLDTCTMQRTIDYALDGDSNASPPVADDLRKPVMLYTPTDTAVTPRARQQTDPLYKTIVDFESGLAVKSETEKASFTLSKITFVTQYCIIVGSTNCASLTAANTDTLFFVWLKNNVDILRPHNKLKPPKLCTDPEKPCPTEDKQKYQPYLSRAGYAAYIDKYLEAFKMCSREGAPRYSKMRLGYLEPHKIYNVGQSFLLLAAVFAFMWSNMIGYYIEKEKQLKAVLWEPDSFIGQKKAIDDEVQWLGYFANGTALLVHWACICLLISLSKCARLWGQSPFTLSTEDEDQMTHANDEASNFFMVLFWLILFASLAIFSYLYFGVMHTVQSSKLLSVLRSKVPSAKVVPMAQFSTNSAMYGSYAVTETLVREFNSAIILHLQRIQKFAHVALNLVEKILSLG
jgi:hypothetical protein